jgi:hypothetical protein
VDRCICFMNDGETPVLVFEQDSETFKRRADTA